MHVYAALAYASTTRFRDEEVPPSTRIARALTLRVKAGDDQASAAAARWLFGAFPALASDLVGAVFVPLPSSKSTPATQSFARALAEHVTGASVEALLQRVSPVPSSRLLRRSGLPGVSTAEHIATMGLVGEAEINANMVFVDDVFTTGATANAAAHHLPHAATLIVAARDIAEPSGKEHHPHHFIVDAKTALPELGASCRAPSHLEPTLRPRRACVAAVERRQRTPFRGRS